MHPTETVYRFKMGKGRRNHLNTQLRQKNCSVSIATETCGNPHTMVVTKTREVYKKDCQRVEREKAILRRLHALVKETSGGNGDTHEPATENSGH